MQIAILKLRGEMNEKQKRLFVNRTNNCGNCYINNNWRSNNYTEYFNGR